MVLHYSAQGWGRDRANAHLTSSRLVDEIHRRDTKNETTGARAESLELLSPAFKINNLSCYSQQFVGFFGFSVALDSM